MTHKEMHDLMDIILEQIISTRDEGQKEYAHDDTDVFANFNRVGRLLEEDRKKVLMTYMLKHIDGIAAYVKGHKSQREDVRGRITDSIVYLMLLWGMINEEEMHDTVFGKEDREDVRAMWDAVNDGNTSISTEERSLASNGDYPNGNMQEMRKKRSWVEILKKVGRD